MAIKELKEKLKKVVDEEGTAKDAFDAGFEFSQGLVKEHPWLPIVSNCTLGAIIFIVGYKNGMKRNPIEYVCDPDIEGIAKHGFETAAHLLDVFDEIESLSKNKVTKF